MQHREEKAEAVNSSATLVGAFGSARKDLRHHGTCAQRARRGERCAVRPTAMDDGRMVRERAMQVTATQVSGTGSEGARHGRR
jgi:hypothetical protein